MKKKRNHNLTAANAKLKDLRSRGWKIGMNAKHWEVKKDNYPMFHMSLEQIAEVVYHEGLTETRLSKSAIAAIVRRSIKKIQEEFGIELQED